MGLWIYPDTSQDHPDHSDLATCTTMVEFDQERYKYFQDFPLRYTAEQPIAVPVQAFFFMNASNKLGCIHSNGLSGYQIVKEQCKRCRGTFLCKRCPGTCHLAVRQSRSIRCIHDESRDNIDSIMKPVTAPRTPHIPLLPRQRRQNRR